MALLEVRLLVSKLVGNVQVLPPPPMLVVVKLALALNAEQSVFTCQLYPVLASNPLKFNVVVAVLPAVVQVLVLLVLYCTV